MASAAAAWALLLEPAASLLAPLLRGPDLWALSVASRCKEFGHAWRQLAHVNHWAAGLAQALGSGELAPTTIRSIMLRGPPLGADVARSLAALLGLMPHIEVLDLENQSIGHEGAQALAAGLQQHSLPHLHTLNLGYNFIEVEGMRALGPTLFPPSPAPASPTPSLRALQLAGNSLGVQGTTVLVDAMLAAATRPPQLAELSLAQNNIADGGAGELARLFVTWRGPGRLPGTRGCPFEVLDLAANRIGDEGLVKLTESLVTGGVGDGGPERAHSLAVLDMMYNHCGFESVWYICLNLNAAMRAQPSTWMSMGFPPLRKVNFEANNLESEEEATLHAAYGEVIDRGLVVL